MARCSLIDHVVWLFRCMIYYIPGTFLSCITLQLKLSCSFLPHVKIQYGLNICLDLNRHEISGGSECWTAEFSLELLPAQEWGEWERESHPWFSLSPVLVWTMSTTTSWKEPWAFNPFRFKGSDSGYWNVSLACFTPCPPWPCLLSFAEIPEDLQHNMDENLLASSFRSPRVSLPTLKADKGLQIPFYLWLEWLASMGSHFCGVHWEEEEAPLQWGALQSVSCKFWCRIFLCGSAHSLCSPFYRPHQGSISFITYSLSLANCQYSNNKISTEKNSIFNTPTGPSVCFLSIHVPVAFLITVSHPH